MFGQDNRAQFEYILITWYRFPENTIHFAYVKVTIANFTDVITGPMKLGKRVQ